jgi:CRP/FNR family transcriptional regulator, anaerobic regulatory protein
MNALGLLRRNAALAKGSDAALRRLAHASKVRVFATGERLVHVGLAQRDVIMIAEGTVELYRTNREAQTQVLSGVLTAPAIFGDAELYGGRASGWAVSVMARVETTAVLMPIASFDSLIDSEHAVAAALYRDAAARLFLAVQIMQVLSLQKTQNKILRLLWRLAPAPADPSAPREIKVSQTELSRTLGVNARTIARNLVELEQSGFIRKNGNRVELLISSDAIVRRDMEDVGFGASWTLAMSEGEEEA